MMGPGRPLRFLGGVAGCWVLLRIILCWPYVDSVAALVHAIAPPVRAATFQGALTLGSAPVALDPAAQAKIAAPPVLLQPSAIAAAVPSPPPVGSPVGSIAADAPRQAAIVPGLPPQPSAPPHRSRLSGSFWLIARGGSGLTSGLVGGQLGGSQAGLRIVYALDRRHRLGLAARLTSPLGAGQREAAIGIEWQPTKLPVRIVAEQRFALNAGKGGPTLGVVGGIGPAPIGAGFRIEGYAQAGVIARDGAEAFGDGALHVSRPVGTLGGIRFDLGGAAWGAAQKGARRLDVGPSLAATVPLGHQAVRLSLDWRERVAGRARPGSGVAFTVGADF